MPEPPPGEEFASLPDSVPGPTQLATLRLLNTGFTGVTIEQRGPNGAEVLAALVLFYACPVCAAVVAAPDEEHPFVRIHADWHLRQAQALDALGGRG